MGASESLKMLPLRLPHSFEMPLQVGFAAETTLTMRAFAQYVVVGFRVWFFLSQRVFSSYGNVCRVE
jgi:hypothetical protein